ncbi:alpha/beta fold hydrolase [Legionella erythra]|uniref:Lipase LipA (L, pneumophila) n=1 Tax=Legionella erythra TaxID=448 RepID=A0A0W0TRT7_LEGER|nr:alpha/beta hydrolase [Legionella erythra]KTC98278.1 lipase LipA (L, pneumophila) [Legionella erythra]
MKATHGKIKIPGFTIAYKQWGNPDNPAILALHGWLDNAGSFNLLAPFLARDFHLIAVDLPGHGLSSHLPPGCHYHFSDGIFTLVNLINAFHLDTIHLLGHSMGACLASLMAGVVPERIRSMALIEAIGPFSSPEARCCEQLAHYARHLNDNSKAERPYPSLEAAAHARAKRGYLSFEHAAILCERGVRKHEGSYYWRHDRRLIAPTPLRLTEGQILSCLKKIAAKSCLILAEQGFNFDENDIEGRVKAVNNLEVTRLGGGHHLHMEKPDTVGQYLVDFFKTA